MGLGYALKQQGTTQHLGGSSVGGLVGEPQSLGGPEGIETPSVDMATLSEEMAIPAYLEAEREAVLDDDEGFEGVLPYLASWMPGKTAIEGGLAGVGVRAGELIGGLTRLPETVAELANQGEWFEENAPEWGTALRESVIPFVFGDREQVNEEYAKFTWEETKRLWNDEGAGAAARQLPSLVLKEGPAALVDGVLLLAGPKGWALYGAARTGEIAEDREQASGEENTAKDVAISLGTVAAVAALDRIGLGAAGLKRLGAKNLTETAFRNRIADAVAKAQAKLGDGILARGAAGAAAGMTGEAATEFLQEGLEAITTQVRDDFSDLSEVFWDPATFEQALAGAIIGGGVGGSIGVVTGARAGGGKLTVDPNAPAEDLTGAVEEAIPSGTPGQSLVAQPDLFDPEVGPPMPPRAEPAAEEQPAAEPTPAEQLSLNFEAEQPAPVSSGPPEAEETAIPVLDPGSVGVETDDSGEQTLTPIARPEPEVEADDSVGDEEQIMADLRSTAQQRAAAERSGQAIENLPLGQFVNSALKGEDTSGGAKTTQVTPSNVIINMFDALSRYTVARGSEIEAKLLEQGGLQGRNVEKQLKAIRATLQGQARIFRQVAMDTRRAATAEVDAPRARQISGFIANNLEIMDRLGIQTEALRQAGAKGTPGNVRTAMENLTKELQPYIQRAESRGTDTQVENMGADPNMTRAPTEASRRASQYRISDQQRGTRTAAVQTATEKDKIRRNEEGQLVEVQGEMYPRGSPEAQERSERIRAEELSSEMQQDGYTTDYRRKGRTYEGDRTESGELAAEPQPVRTRQAPQGSIPAGRDVAEAVSTDQGKREGRLANLRSQLESLEEQRVGTTGRARVELTREIKDLEAEIFRLERGGDRVGPVGRVTEEQTPAEFGEDQGRTRAPKSKSEILGAQRAKLERDKRLRKRQISEAEGYQERLAAAQAEAAEEIAAEEAAEAEAETEAEQDTVPELDQELDQVERERREREDEYDRRARQKSKTQQKLDQEQKKASGTIKTPKRGVLTKETRKPLQKQWKDFVARTANKPELAAGILKMVQDLRQTRVAGRGIGGVWVLNPAAEDANNMLVWVRGGQPKASFKYDENKNLILERRRPSEPGSDLPFSAPEGRTYYRAEDVLVIQGNRVHAIYRDEKSDKIRVAQRQYKDKEGVIAPNALDEFVVMLDREGVLAGHSPTPEQQAARLRRMTEYLLGKSKPKKTKPSTRAQEEQDIIDDMFGGDVTDDSDPEDVPTVEDLEDFDDVIDGGDPDLEGMAGAIIDSIGGGRNPNAENSIKKLREEIAELEAKLANVERDRERLEESMPEYPVEGESLVVRAPTPWMWAPSYKATDSKDSVLGVIGLPVAPRDQSKSQRENLETGVMVQFDGEVVAARRRLVEAEEQLEEYLDDAGSSSTPGGGKKTPGVPGGTVEIVDGPEPQKPDEDGGGRPDVGPGPADDGEYAVRPAPVDRPTKNLFGHIIEDALGLTAFLDRTRAYQFSRPDGRPGLSEHQVQGAARLIRQHQKARERGVGGFLNFDGTGVGKTLQVAVSATEIARTEMARPDGKPVLVVIPGGTDAKKSKLIQQMGKEFRLLGTDLQAKLPSGEKAIQFSTYQRFSGGRPDTKEYSAVLADEAHSIKGGESKKWASNFAALRTPFVAYFTATPADKEGQVVYFLAEMERRPGENRLQARKRIADELLLSQDSESGAYFLPESMSKENFLLAVEKKMEAIARDGGVVSRTMGRLSENMTEDIGNTLTPDGSTIDLHDQDAQNLMVEKNLRGKNPAARHLNEHVKIPYAVAKAKEAIDKGWQPIVMFRSSGASASAALKGTKYAQPAIKAFEQQMRMAGYNKALVLRGDSTEADSAKIKAFQDGDLNWAAVTDQRASTGLDLDDTTGGAPRVLIVVNTDLRGDNFLQTLGRHDRASTTTIPRTIIPRANNDVDRAWRTGIRNKIAVQDRVTGMEQAARQDQELAEQQVYNEKDFLKRARESRFKKDNLDVEVAEAIGDGINRNARDLVRRIARSTDKPALAALADRLLALDYGWDALGVQLMSEADVEASGAVGLYHPNRQLISLSDEGDIAQSFMHEVVHHFAHVNVGRDPRAAREIDAIMKAILDSNPEMAQEFSNAFLNRQEFIAEAFTDGDLQSALMAHTIKGTKLSTWDRFVRWVQKLLGVTTDPTMLESIIALDLFRNTDGIDFDSMPLHKMRPPNKPNREPKLTVEKIDAALRKGRWPISGNEINLSVRQTLDKLSVAKLKAMTFNQIVDSFKQYANRTVESGTVGGNILEDVLSTVESLYAFANKHSLNYERKVLDPLRGFATKEGKKLVKVRMREGAEPEVMTQLEYLAHVMNISGYAQVNFGQSRAHRDNRMLKTNATARAAWKIHNAQFARMPEARKVYQDLDAYFKSEQRIKRKVVAGRWLDTVFPDAVTPWAERTLADIDKEVKRMTGLSDERLKELGASRDALDDLKKLLQPGIVPGAYFPLRRYGRYVVVAQGEQDYDSEKERDELLERYPNAKDDPDNEQVKYKTVAMFESAQEAERYKARLEEDLKGNENVRVRPQVMERAEPVKLLTDTPSTFSGLMRNFQERVDKRSDMEPEMKSQLNTLFGQALLDMMPETSVANAMRPRQGTHGASLDIMRVLHNHGQGQGFMLGHLTHARPLAELMTELNGEVIDKQNRGLHEGNALERVKRELTQRLQKNSQSMMELGPWGQRISDVGFLYYLVGASYNLVNATQPILVGYPDLAARHGELAAARAMKTAFGIIGKQVAKDFYNSGLTFKGLKNMMSGEDFNREDYDVYERAIKPNLTDDNHKQLLREMIDLGDIEASLAMDMSRTSARSHVDSSGNPKPMSKWDYLTDWMRTAPHITEVMNRSVMAIAAFDLEYSKSKNYEKAKAEARRAVKQTQFVYQNWNKPPAFQNQLGRVLLMFKQHVQHMYYYMMRNAALSISKTADPQEKAVARKALTYFVGMHVLAAGAVGGTPEPIKWMLGLLYHLLSDDDEPWDYDRMVRNTMYDMFGEAGATFASQGLPGFLGVDLAGRIGIDSMLLYDGLDTGDRDSFLASVAETAGGPMVGLMGRGVDGYNKMRSGMFLRGMEDILPKSIRDPMRAIRYSNEGFRDLSGKTYLSSEDLSWWDYTQQAIGFQPKKASDTYASRAVGQTRNRMMTKRQRLFTRFYNAEGAEERAEVIERIKQWNRDNPDFAITRDSLIRSVKQRRRIELQTEKGVYIPKSQRSWAAEQQRSY